MFSKTNKTQTIDPDQREQREQYEYARNRIKQKKNLMRHFIVFLIGCIFLIVLNTVFHVGEEVLIKTWFPWAILIWAFLFLIHVFNVFVMNKFMGKEWEDRQLETLKEKQQIRINELKKQALTEVTVAEVKAAKETEALNQGPTDFPDIKNRNSPLLPPDVE